MFAGNGGISLVENYNEIFLYSQKYNDTVYRYDAADKITKVFSLTHKDRFVDRKGVLLSLPYISDRYIFCSLYNLEAIINDEGIMNGMSSSLRNMALIDTEDHSVKIVNKVTYNMHSLNLELPIILSKYEGFFINSTMYTQAYEAYKLKEEIEKTLLEQQLPDSDRRYLENLTSQLSEESNPVIIIGKRKK